MPNRNYQRGVRFEREILQELKALDPDSIVMRASGSHGQYDIMAYCPSFKKVFLVQAKTKLIDDEKLTGKIITELKFTHYNVDVYGEWHTKYIKRRTK